MKLIQQTEFNHRDLIKKKNNTTNKGIVFLKSNKTIKKIHLSEIDYFEAKKNKAMCFIKGEAISLGMELKHIEEMLSKEDFIRIHKSYIIPIGKIDRISGHTVYINDEVVLPIGMCYRKPFYLMLNSFIFIN